MASTSIPGGVLGNPPWVTALFSDTRFAWLWLIARIYIGWGWLHAGWGKITSDAWMDGGGALQGYWANIVVIPETGRATIAYDWYRRFIEVLLDAEAYTWFAKLIALGEFTTGLALLLGVLTGFAATSGAFMNLNFMLAGTSSTNPIMALIAIGVVIAWKTAGWWGLDRVVLPAIGAPWQPGRLFGGSAEVGPDQTRFDALEIERWARVLVGAGLGLSALIWLSSWPQVLTLAVAAAIVAATGLGWGMISKRE